MSDDTVTIFLVFVSFLTGCFFGGVIVLETIRNNAVEAGAAHWSIDPTTGDKSFVFQPPPTKTIHNE